MGAPSGLLRIGLLVVIALQSEVNDSTPKITPKPGIVIPACKIDRVIDGDTVVVSRVIKFRVRLRDCWAPESKKTNRFGLTEKKWGLQSKKALEEWVGKPCSVEVEFDGDEDVGDGVTFGRAVGILYSENQNLNRLQIKTGNAFATKAELHHALKRKGFTDENN